MPRMICFVSLLSCLGAVGTGKAEFNPAAGTHPLAAAQEPASVQTSGMFDPGMLEAGLQQEQPQDIETLPPPEMSSAASDILQLNLPTVLSLIDDQHPVVGLAQWRVQQAYAQLDQARALWLPSIRTGFSFHRHDGNYQASDGQIVDVNRNSFQYGLGVGGTGAGTTPMPGIVAQFHMADAIFQPKIASKTASARSHAARAVVNDQLLSAANAYLELLDAHQDIRIVEATRDSTADLFKLTSDFASAGKGCKPTPIEWRRNWHS